MTNPSFSMTAAEIEAFHQNGFAGPFPLCSPEEMLSIRKQVEQEVLETPSPIYGFEKCPRDRHLDSKTVYDMVKHPAVTTRLQQLLGEDLLVWRSSFFFKPPGAPETVWHRASVFREYVDHDILEPTNEETNLFQLTTWIAIDEATEENGCVQFIAGSHREQYEQQFIIPDSKPESFGNDKKGLMGYEVQVKFDLDPKRLVKMECKPGEFFIFDQRTLHGSPPNNSNKRRMGFNFRAIQPHVKAYGHFLDDGKIEHFGRSFDLSQWGCIVIGGEDKVGLNKIVDPFPQSEQAALTV